MFSISGRRWMPKSAGLGSLEWVLTAAVVALDCAPCVNATPLERLRVTKAQSVSTSLKCVAYGAGRFVTVGTSAAILTSPDGVHWTSGSLAKSSLQWIVYGGDQFVAVGLSGAIVTSPDGLNWTSQRSGTPLNLQSVAYGGRRWVAVGVDGTIISSADGVNWSQRTSGITSTLKSVAYGNGQFVAVTANKPLVSTDNGVNWQQVNSPDLQTTFRICFGNGRFVTDSSWGSQDGYQWNRLPISLWPNSGLSFAKDHFISGYNGQVQLSNDGAVWTTTIPSFSLRLPPISAIAYGDGQFVAVGTGFTMISPDAIEWSRVLATSSGTPSSSPRPVGFSQGEFIGVGPSYDSTIWTSSDGELWTANGVGGIEPLNLGLATTVGAATGNGLTLIVGGSTVIVRKSAGEWAVARINLNLSDATFGQGSFVAVGEQGKTAISTDGFGWTLGNSETTNRLNGVSFGVDRFVAVGDNGRIAISVNGLDWLAVNSGTTTALRSVAFGNGRFAAVGAVGIILTSGDGIVWTAQSTPGKVSLSKVIFANDVFMAVGAGGRVFGSSDGINWTQIKSTSTDTLTGIAYGLGKFLIPATAGLLEIDLVPGMLDTITQSSDGMVVPIVGEVGRVYKVQTATSLAPADWVDLGSVTNNHLSTPFIDRQAGAPYRFYRTVTEP